MWSSTILTQNTTENYIFARYHRDVFVIIKISDQAKVCFNFFKGVNSVSRNQRVTYPYSYMDIIQFGDPTILHGLHSLYHCYLGLVFLPCLILDIAFIQN